MKTKVLAIILCIATVILSVVLVVFGSTIKDVMHKQLAEEYVTDRQEEVSAKPTTSVGSEEEVSAKPTTSVESDEDVSDYSELREKIDLQQTETPELYGGYITPEDRLKDFDSTEHTLEETFEAHEQAVNESAKQSDEIASTAELSVSFQELIGNDIMETAPGNFDGLYGVWGSDADGVVWIITEYCKIHNLDVTQFKFDPATAYPRAVYTNGEITLTVDLLGNNWVLADVTVNE